MFSFPLTRPGRNVAKRDTRIEGRPPPLSNLSVRTTSAKWFLQRGLHHTHTYCRWWFKIWVQTASAILGIGLHERKKEEQEHPASAVQVFIHQDGRDPCNQLLLLLSKFCMQACNWSGCNLEDSFIANTKGAHLQDSVKSTGWSEKLQELPGCLLRSTVEELWGNYQLTSQWWSRWRTTLLFLDKEFLQDPSSFLLSETCDCFHISAQNEGIGH